MGRIRILDEQLTNMIAAGEVVERPASVVKELVENAIDAGATRIEIQIEEGGLALIRVADNGLGMDREDCLHAFERHATSKISSTRDLFQIRTLGFRGEALPSIASVSRMEVTSAQSSGEVGTHLVIEGGRIKEIADKATTKGTDIRVIDLFYNTPARLKYMKSIATEVGHVSDVINRLALTYPAISFQFMHNGKSILQTSGDGKLLHVIAAIYGVQAAKLMLPIEGETLDFRWSGFLSKTELTRANRSYISTLVNGRYIRNYSLAGAVLRGYHTLLPIGRYPIVCLSIEMDPILVDVNVHPAKLEVRFSKEEELLKALEDSVRDVLRSRLTIPQPLAATRKTAVPAPKVVQPSLDFSTVRPAALSMGRPSAKDNERLAADNAWGPVASSGPMAEQVKERASFTPAPIIPSRGVEAEEVFNPQQAAGLQPPVSVENASVAGKEAMLQPVAELAELAEPAGSFNKPVGEPVVEMTQADQLMQADQKTLQVKDETAEYVPESAVPLLFPVGQVHGTYIVAQNEQGMYLIDQHAAQERIFYEFFMEKLKTESVSSQLLLFPHTIECTTQESERLQNRLPLLQRLGLEIEWFGNRSFLVRSHPHWFPEGSELEVIDELIQFILEAEEKEMVDIRAMREKAAIMMSCKASIKANRFLTHAEMEALLERLRQTTSPFTCPHGRPIIIHFSSYELEKLFKRVM